MPLILIPSLATDMMLEIVLTLLTRQYSRYLLP